MFLLFLHFSSCACEPTWHGHALRKGTRAAAHVGAAHAKAHPVDCMLWLFTSTLMLRLAVARLCLPGSATTAAAAKACVSKMWDGRLLCFVSQLTTAARRFFFWHDFLSWQKKHWWKIRDLSVEIIYSLDCYFHLKVYVMRERQSADKLTVTVGCEFC